MNKLIVSTLLMSLTLAGATASARAASVGSGGTRTRASARLETSAAPSRTAVHVHVRGHRHHHRHHAATASLRRMPHDMPMRPASHPAPRPAPHRSTVPAPVSHTRLHHPGDRGGHAGTTAGELSFDFRIVTHPVAGSAVTRLPDRPDVVTSGRGPPRASPFEASGPSTGPATPGVAHLSPRSDAARIPRSFTPSFAAFAASAVPVVPATGSRLPVAACAPSGPGGPRASARPSRASVVVQPDRPPGRPTSVAAGARRRDSACLRGGIPCTA